MNKFKLLISKLKQKTGLEYPQCLCVWTYIGCEILKPPIGGELDDGDLGVCECSKQGLVTLHMFSYEGYEIIIGSKCVEKFRQSGDSKVISIVNNCKEQEKKKRLNDCYFCKAKNVCPPKSKFKIKEVACKNCYNRKLDRIKCVGRCCPYYRPFEKSWDGKGYKKLCFGCFRKEKESKKLNTAMPQRQDQDVLKNFYPLLPDNHFI